MQLSAGDLWPRAFDLQLLLQAAAVPAWHAVNEGRAGLALQRVPGNGEGWGPASCVLASQQLEAADVKLLLHCHGVGDLNRECNSNYDVS